MTDNSAFALGLAVFAAPVLFAIWLRPPAFLQFGPLRARAAAIEARRARSQEVARQWAAAFERARSGDLWSVDPGSLILRGEEVAHASISASMMQERVVGYSGGSAGVSVRVARGVSVRTGAARGRANREMVAVATGRLTITSKRLVFTGDKKSVAVNLSDLTSLDTLPDGIRFTDAGKTVNLISAPGNDLTLFQIIARRLISG